MIDSSGSASQYQYSCQSAYNSYDDQQQTQLTCEFTPFKPTSCIDIKPRSFRDYRLEAYRDAYETATGFEDDEMFCPYELLQVSHLVLSGKLPDSKAPYHNPKKPFKGNLTSLISNSQLLSEHLKNYPLYYTVTKSPPHRTRALYQVSNDTNSRPTPSQFPNSVHPNFIDSGVPPQLHPNNVGYFVPRGVPMSVQPPPHYADYAHYPPLKAYYSQGYPDPNGEPRKPKKSSWYIPRKHNQTNTPPHSSSDHMNNWSDGEQYTGTSPSGTDLKSQYPTHPLTPSYANPSFGVNGFECDPTTFHPVHPPPQQPSQLSATTQEFRPARRTLLDFLSTGLLETSSPQQQHRETRSSYPQQQQQEESPPTLSVQDHTTSVPPLTEDTSNNPTNRPSLISNTGYTTFSARNTQKATSRPQFSQKPKSSRGRTTSLPDEHDYTTACGDDSIRNNGRSGWWRRGEMV